MLDLRKAELREPLGLIFTKADLAAEADQRHFILVNSESHQVVGCALLVNISANITKVRQVAIAEAIRGAGLGRILMNGVEKAAKVAGIYEIELHARENAVPFYERLGYTNDPVVSMGRRLIDDTAPPEQ